MVRPAVSRQMAWRALRPWKRSSRPHGNNGPVEVATSLAQQHTGRHLYGVHTAEPIGTTSGWMKLNLQPGAYVVYCKVPDPKTGKPHVMLGMIAALTAQ